MIRHALRIVACAVLLPSPALASGYYVPEDGPVAMARGGAFTARADDLTSLYLNPAGLSRVRGSNVFLSDGLIYKKTVFKRAGNYRTIQNDDIIGHVPFIAGSSDFGMDSLSVGFAGYGPYGTQRAEFPKDGPQRYSVTHLKNNQVMYTLGAGWNPWSTLRVGATVTRIDFLTEQGFKFSIDGKESPVNDVDISVSVHSEENYIPTGGVQYAIGRHVEIGASYLPAMPVTMKGKVTARYPEYIGNLFKTPVTSDDIEIKITLPHIVRTGVRVMPLDSLDIEVDVVWMSWSVLSSYPLHFKNGTLVPPQAAAYGVAISDTSLQKSWTDTLSAHLGTEYAIVPSVALRAGYFFEQGATPDVTLDSAYVDSDKHGFCAGVGWSIDPGTWGGWTVGAIRLDAAYSYIRNIHRKVNFSKAGLGAGGYAKGDYDNTYNNVAVSLSWKFL